MSSVMVERGASRVDPLRVTARVAPLLGLLGCIAVVAWGWHAGVLRSQEELRAFVDGLGWSGPVVYLLLSAAVVVFPVVPGGLLVISAPVLFGGLWGTVINYVAVCAGSCVNFWIARRHGQSLIRRVFGDRAVDTWLAKTQGPGFARAFAVAIALPVAPDDLLCYLAGTTSMRWRHYVLVILTCKPWALLAYGLGVSALLAKVVPW